MAVKAFFISGSILKLAMKGYVNTYPFVAGVLAGQSVRSQQIWQAEHVVCRVLTVRRLGKADPGLNKSCENFSKPPMQVRHGADNAKALDAPYLNCETGRILTAWEEAGEG